MPIFAVRNDITHMECDAIVNSTNIDLIATGGADAAIHSAAGPMLDEACAKAGHCGTGKAVITDAYGLKSRYVIHTVAPVWHGGAYGEELLLESCYRECLKLAVEHHCESIAFPLIAAGSFGYPKARAMKLAERVIGEFLQDNEMLVYIVIYGRSLFDEVKSFIDDNYIGAREFRSNRPVLSRARRASLAYSTNSDEMEMLALPKEPSEALPMAKQSLSLEDMLDSMDESFRDMLLRKIDESGMTDAECYKKAFIDRKHFNKIKNNKDYKPGKYTVLSFAVALRLNLDDTKSLLEKAGYALSRSSKGDLIIEYFIRTGNYDFFEINNTLYEFNQPQLGS